MKTAKTKVALMSAVAGVAMFQSQASYALDAASIGAALRISNTVTGGLMPSSDPLFAQMVTRVQANDLVGAASIAANSNYFAQYLARRLALQMQNPSLSATGMSDNDATAFLVAHFVGSTTSRPSLSTIWSDNSTYLVNVGGANMHAADLSAAQLLSVNWSSSLMQVAGQKDASGAMIPQKHVGGYTTLSDRAGDNSYAMYGATAGTNLRMIEGIWEISSGLALVDFESTQATPDMAPRFVPENNPNFFHGQGQTACIACHGGGLSSFTHGYATVADVFDYGTNGLTYIPAATTAQRKSLGSDSGQRTTNLACNLAKSPNAVCNPDSMGAALNTSNAWDVSAVWAQSGVLDTLGWKGPMTGQGLNELGAAIGQSTIVYTNFAKRVVNEICPLGGFSPSQISAIAAAANPYATPAGTDDIRTIVAMVAASANCQ